MKKRIVKRVVDIDTAEVGTLIIDKPFLNRKAPNKQFVKVFTENIPILQKLNLTEIRMVLFIMAKIKPNSVNIRLNCHELNIHLNIHRHTFYSALKTLLKCEILTSTNYPNIYKINSNFFFNGY